MNGRAATNEGIFNSIIRVREEKTQEEEIPDLAVGAIKEAYKATLQARKSVLIADNGVLYEIFPDGTKTPIKPLKSPTPIRRGQTATIR